FESVEHLTSIPEPAAGLRASLRLAAEASAADLGAIRRSMLALAKDALADAPEAAWTRVFSQVESFVGSGGKKIDDLIAAAEATTVPVAVMSTLGRVWQITDEIGRVLRFASGTAEKIADAAERAVNLAKATARAEEGAAILAAVLGLGTIIRLESAHSSAV